MRKWEQERSSHPDGRAMYQAFFPPAKGMVRKAAAAIVMAKVATDIMVARKKQMQMEHAHKAATASAETKKAFSAQTKLRLQLEHLEQASAKTSAKRKMVKAERAAKSKTSADEKAAKYYATPEGMQRKQAERALAKAKKDFKKSEDAKRGADECDDVAVSQLRTAMAASASELVETLESDRKVC